MTLCILGIIHSPVILENAGIKQNNLILCKTVHHELMITCVVLNWPGFAGQDCPP